LWLRSLCCLTVSFAGLIIFPDWKYTTLELNATNLNPECDVNEFASLLRRLRRLRPFLNAQLPEELIEVRARLVETHPGGRAGSTADMELLHTVAIALTSQSEPVSMGELSRYLDVPLSTATRLMDWLVKGGYAERLPDPQDRRVVRVGLTQHGRQIYRGVNTLMCTQVERWLHDFTPEECRTLTTLLLKLVDAIEES
jgi:DNA-binding MarR family transcriptional regulator